MIPADFKPFPHDFPTRDNCDPTNPYQAFLWMLVAMPYQQDNLLVYLDICLLDLEHHLRQYQDNL